MALTLYDFCSDLEALASGASSEDRKILNLLLSVTDAWKTSSGHVSDLVRTLDRTLGHAWLSHDDMHADVIRLIDKVRAEADALSGMTMNERLFVFGLTDAWEGASEATRAGLRRKLSAP